MVSLRMQVYMIESAGQAPSKMLQIVGGVSYLPFLSLIYLVCLGAVVVLRSSSPCSRLISPFPPRICLLKYIMITCTDRQPNVLPFQGEQHSED